MKNEEPSQLPFKCFPENPELALRPNVRDHSITKGTLLRK